MSVNINPRYSFLLFAAPLMLLLAMLTTRSNAQAELEPWGNLSGVRHKGQLFQFETNIKVQRGNNFVSTGKDSQRSHYKRYGDEQVVTTNIDSLFIREVVKDESGDKVKVTVSLIAHADYNFENVFFCLQLPVSDYGNGGQRVKGGSDAAKNFVAAGQNYDGPAKSVQFKSPTREARIDFDGKQEIRIRKDISSTNDAQLYAILKAGGMSKGDSVAQTFVIRVSGDIDRARVGLVLNTAQQGRPFVGLGGNFRLQSQKFDPQVIDYCLANLRVAYGRVEMPWRYWQPAQNVDPTAAAEAGNLHSEVKRAMAMAHRLDSLGIPFILSAWYPPAWAVIGKINYKPVNGVWGNQLNKDSMTAIYQSIADYILYMKRRFGAEPKYFSFNESDLGVNVRITAQEQDDFIKGCGAYFAAHGVSTKMLLGDNSNATTWHFIDAAMNDPAAKPYIGAVAFHSWHGFDAPTLRHWADAATRLNLPLLITEGGIDAAAYTYPDVFGNESFALKEIEVYTRILAVCQPLSILQWQLTSDYSPLIGGGIFGNNQPLHPGQRFFNLKQLASTPQGLFAMPITCDRPDISVAALGDNSKALYAVHLVNTGAKRKIVLTGLPGNIKQMQLYVTNNGRHMKDGGFVRVKNGKAKFKADAASYISLFSR